MFKKIFNKSNTKPVTALMAGVLLVLSGYFYINGDPKIVPVTQAVEVVWPREDVNLFENQVFIVDLVGVDINSGEVKVFWDLENGALGDEMVFDSASQFKSEVDVSSWDWKKDDKYKISFLAKKNDGVVVAESSVMVYVGDASTEELIVIEKETSAAKVPEVENEAAVYQPVIKKTATVTPTKPLTPKSNFSVKWVPADAMSNQTFVYNTDGYNDNEIVAFWSAEGGHKNLVYRNETTKTLAASINVYGWRWLEKGPYKIHFTIADKNTSTELASESFNVSWKGEPGSSDIEINSLGVSEPKPTSGTLVTQTKPVKPVVLLEPVNAIIKTPVQSLSPVPQVANTSINTLTKNKLFVPAKPAVEQALSSTNDVTKATALKYILSQSNSVWLNGDGYDSDEYIQSILNQAKTNNQIPAFVLYNIPNRDCGSHSSGGTASVDKYKAWIDRIAGNLNNREAIVIVEPDALAQLNCLPENDQVDRLEMIKYAVQKIVPVSRNVMVYIDAGHPRWVDTAEMAKRLQMAGVQQARGFSLNVSNYISTNDNIIYGNYISNLLGGKKYVIDSSRNGNGPSPTREWCNPGGRALGEAPSLSNGQRGNLDAVLWIKFPGESDGSCNGGPGAGGWWTDYAVDLYKNR